MSSQTKFRFAHLYGFTLAETMITLVILGIVATLVVPGLVRKNTERINRTKVRKAMSQYETVLNKIVAENGIRTNSELTSWASWYGDTTAEKQEKKRCYRVKQYFKIKNIDEYCNYVLESDNKVYEVNINFMDINKPSEGDYIYMPEKALKENVSLNFGPINNDNLNEDDIIVLSNKGNKIYLQRFFG